MTTSDEQYRVVYVSSYHDCDEVVPDPYAVNLRPGSVIQCSCKTYYWLAHNRFGAVWWDIVMPWQFRRKKKIREQESKYDGN